MKKHISAYVAGFLTAAILLVTFGAFAEGNGSSISVALNKINISVKGEAAVKAGDYYTLDNGDIVPYSILYKGTTYLPIRKVAELLGMSLNWNSAANLASISAQADTNQDTGNSLAGVIAPNLLLKANRNDFNGALYNNVFYIELTNDVQDKYNVTASMNKDGLYTVAGKKTGKVCYLSPGADGYVRNSQGIIYCRMDKVYTLFSYEMPAVTQASSQLEPISASQVDQLEIVSQKGLNGVVLSGVFYADINSLNSKFKYTEAAEAAGLSYIRISPAVNGSYEVVHQPYGWKYTMAENIYGYVTNSSGISYLNTNTIEIDKWIR